MTDTIFSKLKFYSCVKVFSCVSIYILISGFRLVIDRIDYLSYEYNTGTLVVTRYQLSALLGETIGAEFIYRSQITSTTRLARYIHKNI